MAFNSYCFIFIQSLLIFLCFQSIRTERLRGATVQVTPYVYESDNEFQGYCVDVMNEISKIAGFNYSLYFTPGNRHGDASPLGEINGLLGEVFHNFSDFGIADLTVTEDRKRYVNFSLPIMRLGVSALIHKTNAERIERFRDLPKQTRTLFGVVKGGRILKRFRESNDETIKQMYYKMVEQNSLVPNKSEGIRQAKVTEYAFIQESADNEFIAANDCDLTSIRDKSDYFKTEYAIALPKNSPHLSKINFAIRKMEERGEFDRIKSKYWASHCGSSAHSLFNYKNWILIVFTIILSTILRKC